MLRRDLMCVDPFEKHGELVVPATEVDHIVPRCEAPRLELSLSNLAGLCRPCHSVKTWKEKHGGLSCSELQKLRKERSS